MEVILWILAYILTAFLTWCIFLIHEYFDLKKKLSKSEYCVTYDMVFREVHESELKVLASLFWPVAIFVLICIGLWIIFEKICYVIFNRIPKFLFKLFFNVKN